MSAEPVPHPPELQVHHHAEFPELKLQNRQSLFPEPRFPKEIQKGAKPT
jgi:hypothetical protein